MPVPQITGLLNSVLAVDHEVTVTRLWPLLSSSPSCPGIGQEMCLTLPLR